YRGGFRIDKANKWTVQGNAYRTMTEQFRPELFLVAPFAVVRNQTIKYEGVNLLGRWNHAGDDGSLLTVQSYVDWTRRDEPFNFVDKRIIFDLETQYNFPTEGIHDVIAGAGFRFAADNEKGNRSTSFSPQGRHDSLYSFFLQDKLTL